MEGSGLVTRSTILYAIEYLINRRGDSTGEIYARINYSHYERNVRFAFLASRAVVYMQYLALSLYPSVISAVRKILQQCIVRILDI